MHGEPISTNLICMQPAGVVLGQLCTQCIYCDALCSVTVACVSSFRGQNNLTLKSYSTESGFNSRFLQENIIIIHLSWIPLGPLSLCFLTHYLYCNFSITSWQKHDETFSEWISLATEVKKKKTWKGVILDAWNPKVLTYIVQVVMNMKRLDYVSYYCIIHKSGTFHCAMKGASFKMKAIWGCFFIQCALCLKCFLIVWQWQSSSSVCLNAE